MRIKKGFELRDVCGEFIIVAFGEENIDFTKIINLNASAAMLWNAVIGTDFTAQTLADLLCREYDVDADTAMRDAEDIAARWHEVGLIE